MQEGDVATALRHTFTIIVELGAPPLLSVLAIGLVVSIIQSVTQINEQTLAFVPKLLGVVGVFALFGHLLFATLATYTQNLFDQLIIVGGT